MTTTAVDPSLKGSNPLIPLLPIASTSAMTPQTPTTFLGIIDLTYDEGPSTLSVAGHSKAGRQRPTTFLGVLEISDEEDSGENVCVEVRPSLETLTVSSFIDLTED